MDDYIMGPILGKGSFGIVYLAEQKSTGNFVAIKQIEKSKLNTSNKKIRAKRDIFIPKFLGCQHKNIICVLDAIETDESIFIISEYLDNTKTLKSYIPNLTTHKGQLELLDLFQQLADGLNYMHSQGIIHNDIKLANILVKANIPFYIDFDLSCTLPYSELKRFPCQSKVSGTPNYISPEILLRNFDDYRQKDIYALGVVFYAVITQKMPFQRETLNATYLAILEESVPEFTSNIPDLDKLILDMLNKEPIRPTAEEIKNRLNELIRII